MQLQEFAMLTHVLIIRLQPIRPNLVLLHVFLLSSLSDHSFGANQNGTCVVSSVSAVVAKTKASYFPFAAVQRRSKIIFSCLICNQAKRFIQLQWVR